MIESDKIEQQYLHTSNSVFGTKHPDSDSHEVSLGFRNTAFMVYPHRSYLDDNKEALKGGDLIQLFHKEIGAYIAAEGNHFDEPLEPVHLRIRVPDITRPSRLKPPTSAVSVSARRGSNHHTIILCFPQFWQVEIDDDPVSGAIIDWGERVRFRHVISRRYLSAPLVY